MISFRNVLTGSTEDISLSSLKGHNGTVRVLKFRPSESTSNCILASAGAGDCRPIVWDANAGM
jgi:hypothetical protein